MKYRKKPVVVEAVKCTGTNAKQIKDFAGDSCEIFFLGEGLCGVVIHTLEGDMAVERGDFIIRGVRGEFYPCKPDIFEATYEAITE